MLFEARRFLTAALVVALLIQIQLAENGYADRRTKIAFTSSRDGNYEIYIMDGDGKNQRRVTVHPNIDRFPTWSPDGKKIAFVSNRNGGYIQIWVIGADGENPIRLTDGVWDQNPDWSPDGTKIAYDTVLVPEDHDLAPGGITVMDADGNNKKLLRDGGGIHPSWSPDGERIAFMFIGDGGFNQIYLMDADGRNPEPLTKGVGHKGSPCWSPDGESIAYLHSHQIHVMDSDGVNQRQLTRKLLGVGQPTWSPQSDAIAFESWGKAGELGIFLVDVTNGAVTVMQHAPGFSDKHPDWLYPGELPVSPEGSRITMWGRLKDAASSLR